MLGRRRNRQARPRSPSLREQWAALWQGLRRLVAWVVRLTLVIALLSAGSWIGLTLWDRLQVPVAQVVVSGGNPQVPAKWVRQQLQPLMGTDLWQVNLDAARQRIETNPWVASVTVSRRWPDALQIGLTVHQPIARWQGNQLLDDQGRVFRPPPGTMPQDLPVINGPDGQQWALWERYLTFKSVLAGVGLRLVGVLENSRGSKDLLLEHGTLVRLGKTQIETRLQRFLDVYPKTLADKMPKVAVVDLRYTNGFAVKWRHPAPADKKTKRKRR